MEHRDMGKNVIKTNKSMEDVILAKELPLASNEENYIATSS